MAVPTLPVSIGSPTELITPKSASVSNVSHSNSGAFKTELHNASQSNSARKSHDLARGHEKNSDKSTVNDKFSSSSNNSERSSSLNAKDTNTAKASEQQSQQTTTTKNNKEVERRSEAELNSQQNINALQQDNGHSLPPKGDELPQSLEGENVSEFKLGNLKSGLTGQNTDVSHLNNKNSANFSVPAVPVNPMDSLAENFDKVAKVKTSVDSLAAARVINTTDNSVAGFDKVVGVKTSVDNLAATRAITPIASSAENFDKPAEVKANVDSFAATARATSAELSMQTASMNDNTKVNVSVVSENTASASLPAKAAVIQNVISTNSKLVTDVVPNVNGIAKNEAQPLGAPTVNDKNLSAEEKSALKVSTAGIAEAMKSAVQPNNNIAESANKTTNANLDSSLINGAVQNKATSGNANVEIDNTKLTTAKPNLELQGVAVNTDKLVNQVNAAASQGIEGNVNLARISDLAGGATSNIADRPITNSEVRSTAPVFRAPQKSNGIDSEGISSKSTGTRGLVGNNVVDSVSIASQAERTAALNTNNTPIVNTNNGVSLANDSKSSVEQAANEAAKLPNNFEAKRFDPSIAQSSLGTNTVTVASPVVLDQSMALNQSLEKMRAGIESGVIGNGVRNSEESEKGNTSSIIKSVAASEGFAQLASLQGGIRSTNPVQMQMPPGTPPTSKNWGKAVADKVYIAASQNLRVANIHLDPPELGALQIRLQVTGPDQQMSVAFSSPHASVRDALDQQLPRLREMLEEQGINLGESSVNDQNSNNKQSADSDQQKSAGYVSQNDIEGPVNPLNTQGTLSLVDFYA